MADEPGPRLRPPTGCAGWTSAPRARPASRKTSTRTACRMRHVPPHSQAHAYSSSCSSCRERCSKALTARRRSIMSRVCMPALSAFWLPGGAPDPAAPPCMRHRRLPFTAGARHERPDRVLAPQRGLRRIGPVLRGCSDPGRSAVIGGLLHRGPLEALIVGPQRCGRPPTGLATD